MKKKSKLLEVAKKMPPLYHTLPGEDFDIHKSEVVKWLISQPEILEYVYHRVKVCGGVSGAFIKYDPETGKWKGVDHDGMVSVLHSLRTPDENPPDEKSQSGEW